MKTKQRKELELQAMLTNTHITYGSVMPKNPKIGDRWYDGNGWGYTAFKLHNQPAEERNPFWMVVSTKTFFDLTKS